MCPACGREHRPDERFCTSCGMPLVRAGDASEEPAASERHERARKIRPELTRGPLVRVAGGRNQPEAELIQNLLLEEGVPSVLRRSAGFDVPDFLAAGPRDVLVPESGAEVAHAALNEADLAPPAPPDGGRGEGATRRQAVLIALAVLGGGALAALLAWLLLQAGGY